MKHIVLNLILSALITASSLAQETSVLFLGNSYTQTQNLPGTLYNLALAGGDTIYQESNTPGGYTLEGHSTNATTLSKIASRDWDFVVLQEQSQRPSFGEAQVAAQVYPFAEILVDSIRSNYQCTEPIFFMTWGRRDGDQQNCAGFPALCTFEGMQERLRNAYLEMTFDNDATVAPCGAAWQQMALVNNTFWNGLYSGDGSHPSAWGTYLNACVFYATILRKSPVGLDYYSSIGETDAVVLQQLAEDIVLDSLSSWNIGHADVVADANFVNEGGSGLVDFSNSSVNATNHFWDFGDGNVSSLAAVSHNYSSAGTFEVQYIASSACDSDTVTFEVSPSPNSIHENDLLDLVHVTQHGNRLFIKNALDEDVQLTVLDLMGRMILRKTVKATSVEEIGLNQKTQMYLLQFSAGNLQSTRKVFIQ